jgi:glucose/arabinose dehydrogenase
VVATKLAAPTGIALLPDGTALVGERTTGRIVRVQPRPGQPVVTVRTLGGLDTRGDGGLLDLALSPHYLQDNLIFAYLTTPTDNRVVTFTLNGPVTPVVTGIPKGAAGNTGRITFGPDGRLYVGTGDTGSAALAEDPGSLAGKVLRVTDIGEAAPDNPTPSSRVFTSGHREVDGLCVDVRTQRMIQVQSGPDEINALIAGESYGGNGHPPLATPPAQYPTPGGCAVLDGVLYLTSLDGHALLAARLAVKGGDLSVGKFEASLQDKYGRLRTVVAAPDGALWLTTSNRDGTGKPVPDDERVLRIVPSGGGATAPV